MLLECSSKAEGVGYINNQLSLLDLLIEQVLVDRVSLLHQLNDLQSSDRILPDKILSSIFIMAYDGPDKAISPIVLGAVCSRWRRVAWSTPPLWSAIGPIPHHPIRQLDVEILRLYLQNTAQRPIHISLNLACLPPRCQDTKRLFSAIFVENPMKVQKLTLSTTHSPGILTKIKRAIERSNLCNLAIVSFVARKQGSTMPIPPPLTTLYHSAVNLHTLIIGACQLPPVEQISWSPITVLKLRNIPIDECLHLLSQCPKMVEFHCHSTRPAAKGINLLFRSQKELRDLEIFDVDLDECSTTFPPHITYISSLLAHLRFPNLKHMAWGTLPVTPRHQFASFVGAMKSLITFKCTSFDKDGDLVRLFQYLSPTVRKVYLPPLSYTLPRCFHLLTLVTNTIAPSSGGMRTLELTFPDNYAMIFALDLCTIREDFRKVGIHLKISR